MPIVIKAGKNHTYFEVSATVSDAEFERLKKEFPYLFERAGSRKDFDRWK